METVREAGEMDGCQGECVLIRDHERSLVTETDLCQENLLGYVFARELLTMLCWLILPRCMSGDDYAVKCF